MYSQKKVAVIGGGSWATALVKILSNNCDDIKWWLRSPDAVKYIKENHHNPVYLSDVEIDVTRVTPVNSLKEALQAVELIILAVPSAFIKNVLSEVDKSLFND